MISKPALIKPRKAALVRPPLPREIYAALIEVGRRDFYSFGMLCLAELNPGKPILHNFHLEALAFRLTQVLNRQSQKSYHQHAASLWEVDFHLNRFSCLSSRPRSDPGGARDFA